MEAVLERSSGRSKKVGWGKELINDEEAQYSLGVHGGLYYGRQRNGRDEFAGGRLRDELRETKFSLENLDNFSVNNRGVTFLYDFGFPHVIKALEPAGRYFFSFEKLKEHIKEDGLLGVFVK